MSASNSLREAAGLKITSWPFQVDLTEAAIWQLESGRQDARRADGDAG